MADRIIALALAISKMNGGFDDPLSLAFKIKNPLLLKCFSVRHEKDEHGYRVFKSVSSGLDAGVMDLEIKCSGKSNSKLTPQSTLKDLIGCYGYAGTSPCLPVLRFLKHIKGFEEVSELTPLGFFLGE
jgi:hypothetical protein